MVEMTKYIREAFKQDILKKLDWMDEETKRRAELKLEKMSETIAYSDEFLDKEKVDNLHKGLVMSPTDLVGNAINLNKFWRKFERSRLREKIDRRSWLEHSYVALVHI